MSKLDEEIEKIEDQLDRDSKEEVTAIYNRLKDDVDQVLKRYEENYEQLSVHQRLRFEYVKQLSQELDELYEETTEEVNRVITKQKGIHLNEGYLTEMYKAETITRERLPFLGLDRKFVRATIMAPVDGQRMSSRLYKHRRKLAKSTESIIRSGVVQGLQYGTMARNIHSATEANHNQALRIVRTETGRMRSESRQKAYEELYEEFGIVIRKRWVSALDEHTRSSHRHLDGQVVDFDEEFTSSSGAKALAPKLFGVASEDINCRCRTISVYEDYKVRRDGSGSLIKDMNYDQWKQERSSYEV